MPVISTLGAASSRGFGEFRQQSSVNYIEDYFAPYIYTGTGANLENPVNPGIAFSDTASWSTFRIFELNAAINRIAVDSSENVYAIGSADGGSDYSLIAKYNSSGALQWARKLSSTSGSGRGVAVNSSGDVYTAAYIQDSGVFYISLAKYNSSGTFQWERKLQRGASRGYGVALDTAGNPYIVGNCNDGSNYGIVAKYNSSGSIQWQRKLRQGASLLYDVSIDASDNVYVVGTAVDTSTYGLVAKYNSSGSIQWQRKFKQGTATASALGVSSDSSGNVYVIGTINDGSQNLSLMKYDSSGALQWQRKVRQVSSAAGYGVTVDSSGNVYAVGLANDGGAYAIIVKYDSSGTLSWQKKIRQISATLRGVSVTSSGNLFVAGEASNGTLTYGCISKLKTDASTSSGNAFVTLSNGTATSSTSTATDSAGTATDSAGDATDSAGPATDAAATATFSIATQPSVSGGSGLAWIKLRGASAATYNHYLYDTVRGATKSLSTNLTSVEATAANGLTEFTASGFIVDSLDGVNKSASFFANWSFREKTKFFDIVSYTGSGSNRTISHSLGSVPGMIIIKPINADSPWIIYHRSIGNTKYMKFNQDTEAVDTTIWNSTTPTSTVFSLGTSTSVNNNGTNYIAYLFAHNAGGFGLSGTDNVISCGSYVGNGGSTVNTINIGYEPQFVMIKSTQTAATDWVMLDSVRGMPTLGQPAIALYANSNASEDSGTNLPWIGVTPTGFNIDQPYDNVNINGETYIYMAIRRGPMKVPTDATSIFYPTVYTGTNVNNRLVNTTIAPDMVWVRQRNATDIEGMLVADRIRTSPYLKTGDNDNENTTATAAFDNAILAAVEYGTPFTAVNGFYCGTDATAKLNVNTTANNHIAEAFKRAPSFFDIVTYTGNFTARTISHNLVAVPQLILLKDRTSDDNWQVYSQTTGAGQRFFLNTNNAAAANTTIWNNTSPTSSVFSVGANLNSNSTTGNYVAYLFATCAGVSKVGSYTGTGTTQQIDCGFSSGARFVLIKRTDTTGDWYIYDSARGIIAGNDPYIIGNSTAAEVTGTDYVDTYSAGFELSSAAPAGLNANGGTFIYLAIA